MKKNPTKFDLFSQLNFILHVFFLYFPLIEKTIYL
jgi:hypothetical protein